MNEEELKEYDEIFDFLKENFPDWERLLDNDSGGNVKIKTNQHTVQFASLEQVLQKFNLKIIDISYTDYYGIVFGIRKLRTGQI